MFSKAAKQKRKKVEKNEFIFIVLHYFEMLDFFAFVLAFILMIIALVVWLSKLENIHGNPWSLNLLN